MRKIGIVNKYGPFGKAITGRNAKELTDYLVRNNIEVIYYCLSAAYKSEETGTKLPLAGFQVKEIKNFYNGNSPALRLIWGFIDGFRLWLCSLQHRTDAVIVMTDPPLLFFWFQLFRRFTKRKLFYWTMDIYPDAFVAGNYIKPGNLFYKFFHLVVYRRMPDLIIALGMEQLEFLDRKFKSVMNYVILPCGIVDRKEPLPGAANGNKISFAYGGNMGEAHDANFLVSLIRHLDPAQHSITLSLYGAKAAYVRQKIVDESVVIFKNFLDYSDIESIDVNVATILPEWNHICVPSKAVTAICCGSSLLLNASRDTDAWNMFEQAAWLVEPGENYDKEIRKAIGTITKEEINKKKIRARQLAKTVVSQQQEAFKAITRYINL